MQCCTHPSQYRYNLLVTLDLVPLVDVNNCYFTILTTRVVTMSVGPVLRVSLLGDSIVPKQKKKTCVRMFL